MNKSKSTSLETIYVTALCLVIAAQAITLDHPVVILLSSDGFRFGHQFKTDTKNISLLIDGGVEAKTGLIPVFPTETFPNHYSIATGLYPAHHGIINNRFYDPDLKKTFTTREHSAEFWLGEPLWETVVNHGYNASAIFWPGAEALKGKWTCKTEFCPKYDSSVSFEKRIDMVLNYFDYQNTSHIPAFMAIYFQDPDKESHRVGPDNLEVTAAVAHIDAVVGKLITGLKDKGVFDQVNIILVGDHGLVATCDNRTIALDDIGIPEEWVDFKDAVLGLRPPSGHVPPEVHVAKITEGLENIKNGKHLKVYLKENLPSRLKFSDSIARIPPIVGLVDEGYLVEQAPPKDKEYCGGGHGYDNEYFSMRSIFIGHGPHFKKGYKVDSFVNVEIYNVVTSILKIKRVSNDGNKDFPAKILKVQTTSYFPQIPEVIHSLPEGWYVAPVALGVGWALHSLVNMFGRA